MQIYLDYSATTPTRREAIAVMQEALTQNWGNPSSIHEWGQRAATVVEKARMQVCNLINAPADSLIFTAGGTEADNLAILGVTRQYQTPQHLIISEVEHSAVSKTAELLEQWGWRVTRLPVDRLGRVNPEDLKSALRSNTVLVSLIYGQSEVGTVQPIQELGAIARAAGVLFHVDGVQVVGRLPVNVQELPVDLLSLSSHKIYGPQGAGALYVREGLELVPLLTGGGQESNRRSGTQAVPAIAGFGVAAELASEEMPTETPRLIQLRDRLFDLLADTPELIPTGDRLHRLPHHVSFCLREDAHSRGSHPISGRAIVRQMNLAGIAISSGSACSSGKLNPSPVLLAMGYSPTEATAAVRLTLGRHTTAADIDWTAMVLKQVLARLMPELALARL
ncbi:cysteine desulfurase family protein [Laspinema olomoucense]|uniref:cysteine desulfurase n=1 Tax=Laspinema olomoucense D3b TaxID=2953688 RepID=A0ABT2N7B2_9CYAN|nr:MULTISPECIES: cysteine desulfurase family protein [unclassified Laspinema]MCT7978589.1 cysteine desulfurase [Laspinema sp. D3b]MCT7987180.1 cysteine desulfurase [Laspinema sp. D3a]